MQGTIKLSIKIDKLTAKCKHYSKEGQNLRRCLKDMKVSRDRWKAKAKAEKKGRQELQHRIVSFSQKLAKYEQTERLLVDHPEQHHYSCIAIMFCIWIRQQGNCSLRSCARIVAGLHLMFGLDLGQPSHTSISNWEKKLGHYRLGEQVDYAMNWVILLDESVSIGKQKMLLIIGISLDRYKFGAAPTFEDTVVLYVGIRPSWTGAQVRQSILGLTKAGLRISYSVNDQGNNLRKALKDSNLIHIHDCTHAFSKFIEKRYKNLEHFRAFSKACSGFKTKVVLSDYALYMPPVQRSKGRFLNLGVLSKWAHKTLSLLKEYQHDPSRKLICEKLEWMPEYEGLVEEMYFCCNTMHKVFYILKHQGLSSVTQRSCERLLDKSKAPKDFCDNIRNYMREVLVKLPHHEIILCNGDIIESYFGKLKNRLSSNPQVGMTDSCLTIANFNQNFDVGQVKKAMEQVKIVQLKEWKQKNMPRNMAQTRREIYKKTS